MEIIQDLKVRFTPEEKEVLKKAYNLLDELSDTLQEYMVDGTPSEWLEAVDPAYEAMQEMLKMIKEEG